MMTLKNLSPVLFCLVSLTLAIAGAYLPWWSIRTTRQVQITTNITRSVDYMPFQTILASDIEANKSIAISFVDLPENEANKNDLIFLFKTTLFVSLGGMLMTVLALALTFISILRKPLFNYAWISTTIGGILLFVAPLYLAAEAPSRLAKFANVVPPDLPVLSGSQISSFWGSITPWMWGAGFGWYLLFMSALFAASASVLIRMMLKKIEK